MTEQDKRPFALLMGEMAAAFNRDMPKETMAVYFKHLIDYPLAAVAWAVDKAIKTDDRLPVIKTIREHAGAYRPPRQQQQATAATQIAEFTTDQVDEAKAKIKDLINSIGEGERCNSKD